MITLLFTLEKILSIWKKIFLPFVGISAGGISADGSISIAGVSKHWKRMVLLLYFLLFMFML